VPVGSCRGSSRAIPRLEVANDGGLMVKEDEAWRDAVDKVSGLAVRLTDTTHSRSGEAWRSNVATWC
jgi:hypothetical protein